MKKFTSIKTRTTFYAIIPFVIGFIIICSIMFFSLFNIQRNTVEAEFANIVQKHAASFEKRITNAIDYISFVLSMVKFQIDENITDRETLLKQLGNYFDRYPDVNGASLFFEPNMFDGKDAQYKGTALGTSLSGRASFYFYREDGIVKHRTTTIEEESSFMESLYIEAREQNAPYYTEPFLFNLDGEDIIMSVILFPINDRNGNYIGAVTASFFLGDIFSELQREKIFETGYMIIASDSNNVLYSPRFEDIGRTREEAGIDHPFPGDIEDTVIIRSRSILNNKTTLKAITIINVPQIGRRFSVSVSAPVSEIYAEGNRLLVIILLLGAITIIFVAFFVSYLIGKATRPIKIFKESAENIARGDFSARINGNFNDEFGILKETINFMAERIEDHIEESKLTLRVLQTVLNSIDAFIYVTIPGTGEVLFINEQMKTMFNLKGDEGVGQYCYKLFRKGLEERCDFCPCFELDKDPDKVIVWEENAAELGRIIRHNDRYINWPGGYKVHMQQAIDITDIKTITEEKLRAEREAQDLAQKKEQAEETSRMKSVFLASMSHEIRTPMHGIIGFSDLALDDNISQKTRNYLSKIKTSAESLLLIINDILDVSKIEAGKIELERIPFDIADVFKLCRLIASPNAQEKGLTLFCYAEPSVGRLLLGDPTRLRQVLLNLLSNAIKFTNNGMVKLLAAITENAPDKVTMHFEIKDSGIGMTEDQIRHVFQPFAQADDSTTRKYGGTGLGLTITKSFVELMGGKLFVESSYGVGSKFSFDLTFDTIDSASAPSKIDISINRNEKPVFDGEILICEDNDLNKIVISDHLSKVGLKSIIAENGKIGVDLVNKRIKNGEKPFDLIFMDIHMPEMDGLEAAKKIIGLGSRVPIIALTANIMANDRDTYLASGMVDCLPKPFIVQELWTCLLKYLTPISMQAANNDIEYFEEEDQRMEIIATFIKSNQDTYRKISDALENGDLILSHRLAHTLKSVAALIGMNKLSEAAKNLEQSINLGKTDQLHEQMKELENELNTALSDLSSMLETYLNNEKKAVNIQINDKETYDLLELLKSLLEADNIDSVNLVKKLKNVPGTENLIEQVENLQFKNARETLAAVMRQFTTYGEST